MPMVRRADHDSIQSFQSEQLTEVTKLANAAILTALGSLRVSLRHHLNRLIQASLNDVANRDDFYIGVTQKLSKMAKALLANTDKSKRDSLGW